ncbi:MAG TPA: ABC transporter permease [Vicinamibacterales bacterium]|nr:ABC transporter permease [Vicinamibacterales bacterium]
MFERLLNDTRHTLRWLRNSPGFTLIAVMSLAIGIGLNTALFAVVDAALFRPLPVERPDRLVDFYTSQRDGETYGTSSYQDYLDLKMQNGVFTDVLAYSLSLDAVGFGDHPRLALGEVVTGNYFSVLGLRPQAGRLLTTEDDRPGAPRATVIADTLWSREFGRQASAIGTRIRIHGEPYTIVGVAPRTFSGAFPVVSTEVWTPMAYVDEVSPAGLIDTVPSPGGTGPLDRRGYRWLFIKGRLKEGATLAETQANLRVIWRRLAAAYPKTNSDRTTSVMRSDKVRVLPQADGIMLVVALGFMFVAGLVLLTACANVASMLLARASGRQREIAVRLAIGASRRHLVQQLLTESAVLSVLGAIAGAGVAFAITRAIASLHLPMPVQLTTTVHVDGRVLAFTMIVAAIAGLAAGLAPALQATRPNLVRELKGDPARAAVQRWTLRDGLVVLQVAITMVLLVTAGLLTRSLAVAEGLPVGFDSSRLAVVSTALDLIGYDVPRSTRFYTGAIERVRAIPGVVSACLVTRTPMSLNFNRNEIFPPDRQQSGARGLEIDVTTVSPEYFTVMGVPLVKGRNFMSADTPASPRVAIVNEAMARKIWPEQDPIGQHVRAGSFDGRDVEIIGVVKDYKVHSVGEPATPYLHFAYSQAPSEDESIMARTDGDAGRLVNDMRRVLAAAEPNIVFIDSQTMEAQVGVTLFPARFGALAVGGVGLMAMLLAAVGLYGVIAFSVARRTREIGIRIALGARRSAVLALVLGRGLTLSLGGAVIGALCAVGTARAVARALYGVSYLDPLAWGVALVVVVAVAMLANVVPARRAAALDPSRALRTE